MKIIIEEYAWKKFWLFKNTNKNGFIIILSKLGKFQSK